MNYRISNEFAPPFKLYTIIEERDYKLELRIKLLANISSKLIASNIKVSFNAPKLTQSVYFDLPQQYKQIHIVDYNQNKHICTWKIPKIIGGSETALSVTFTLEQNKPNISRRELGPISMSFEIPNHNISNVGIKALKIISNSANYNPKRWIRTFTKAKSYVARIA